MILRYPKKVRRSMLVTAALEVAEEYGLVSVSPTTVAARCMVPTSRSTCAGYFTKSDLFDEVLADPRCSKEIKRQAKEMGLL